MKYSPTKIILVFFIIVIMAGTLLLSLPIARTNPAATSLLTDFFTATSATCVTGLAVVDIGTYYTLFGQIVILLLIQVGGLGYMTLSTLVGIFIGKIALKERAMFQELFDLTSFAGLRTLLVKIVAIVLVMEGIGAAALTVMFMRDYPFTTALWNGIFNAVSAFCNAGFNLFARSLEPFAGSWPVLGIISSLIILGGIGFLVLVEIGELLTRKRQRVSIHARVVLWTTLVLIASGAVLIGLIEANNTLKGHGLGYGVLNSYFQSVTCRTAGFNSIPIGLCHEASAIIMTLLMFIGASPGGTGGGIKTTTFILVFAFVLMMLREHETVNLYRRRLSKDIIDKSLAILILGMCVVIASTTVLVLLEEGPMMRPINLIFEATSAFGTVGLSRGITPDLSSAGKIVIIVTMLIGRVGPLAFLMALVTKKEESKYIKYPEERIMVG